MAKAAVIAAALALAIGVYGHRLRDSPPYLGLDEAHFANHAHSLATSARDLNGNLLPLFISLEDPLGGTPSLPWGTTWYHPYGFYLIAAALTVLPLAEWSVRLPIVLIGVLNMLLVYAIGRRWHGSSAVAAGAAALLALTPAHFILSRLALDYLLPLPFVLGWLLAATSLWRTHSRNAAIVTGVVLGAGCFSYVSSWLLMPIYLAISGATLVSHGRRDLVAPLLLGFGVPLLALLPWVMAHPDMPANVLAQYQAGESRTSVVTAVLTGQSVTAAMRDAVSAYWSYFDPSFLFVAGGSSRLVSTGSIGVWPMGMAALLLIGTYRAIVSPTTERVVLLAGLLLAPAPAALKGEPFAIQRAVALLPFGVLLGADGLRAALAGSGAARPFVAVIALSIPLQFAGFAGDYFGGYRARAALALDPTAFPESAAVLLGEPHGDPTRMIAMASPLYDISAKWRFFCTKAGRTDLLARTRYFSGRLQELSDLPPGSLAVVEATGATNPGGWTVVARPTAVFGEAPLTILRRH
jgi:4-amino-4-deoxy-L-arabinose transferase-like glycosyltransferase